MAKKRIVMVGLGGISRTHLHHLRQSPSLELVGGIDTSEAARNAFQERESVPAYTSLSAALADQAVDGIIVATPPGARKEIILQALDCKIPVLSEKPLASDFPTAQAIANHPLAPQLIRVGYCHRWTGAAQMARQMIERGELGELVWMTVCFSAWMPDMQSHWMTDPALSGGGSLMDNGCHALDLFAYFGGELEKVQGSLRKSWPSRGDDTFVLSVQSARGTVGTLIGSYLHSAPRNEWEIVGTKGTLRYSYDRSTDTLLWCSGGEMRTIPVELPGLRFPRQLQEWQRHLCGEETSMATAKEAAVINFWIESVMNTNS